MSDILQEAQELLVRARVRSTFDLATHGRPFVTVKDLAGYLDCDRRTIIRMITAGALEAAKVGRSWRIPTEIARAAFHVQRQQAAS